MQKKVIKISVRPEAKAHVERYAERNGMTEIAVASRVYEWWAAQDDVVRKAVLDTLPEGHEVNIVRMVLEGFAKGKAKGGK